MRISLPPRASWDADRARSLLAVPWRGSLSREVRRLLAQAICEIERLRAENERLTRELDRHVFAGAAVGPDGNLGPRCTCGRLVLAGADVCPVHGGH
jgi:hypothetical protein